MYTRIKLALILVYIFCGNIALADCVDPAGVQGQQVYDTTINQMKFCDGGSWWRISNAAIGSHALGTGFIECNAGNEGAVRYNLSSGYIELCDGSAWKLMVTESDNADPSPNAFSFTDVTSQELGSEITSNSVTLAGFTGNVVATATGDATAALQVNGGDWVSSALVTSGDSVKLRATSSNTYSVAKNITLTIGATSDTWSLTTRAGGTRIFYTANTYSGNNLGGLNGADGSCQTEADAESFGGTWIALLSDKQINAKDRVNIDYPVVNACDGSVVEVNDLFGSTNEGTIKRRDNCTAGSHNTWTGTTTRGLKESNSTCRSWYLNRGSARWGRPNTLSDTWITWSSSTCDISSYLYCVEIPTPTPPSTGPAGFTFTDLTNQELLKEIKSNTVTLSGLTGSVDASIYGPGLPYISINSGPYVTGPVSVSNGDTVQLKINTFDEINYAHNIVVNIGATSDTWTVTTKGAGSKIFVTATTYNPSTLGGISGADTICGTEATTHGFTGTWKALLSDRTTNARDHVTFSYPVVNACDDSMVELNRMWASGHEGAIKRGDNCLTSSYDAVTSTDVDGTKMGSETCADWSSSSGNARWGRPSETSSLWVRWNTSTCTTSRYLYCVRE